MASEHVIKAYDRELDQLNSSIAQMGGLAEAQLANAIQAAVARDAELGAETVAADAKIDALEQEVQNQVVRLLALRQPMARDLRNIVAALKVSSDIERIADYAANVAKRATALTLVPAVQPLFTIPRMGSLAQALIKNVLDAYIERDVEKARQVWEHDAELDEAYAGFFRELLTYMMEDPRNITPCTHLLFIAKNIERIGDHATNIAETVHFLVEGTPFRENRPKGDTSSFTVVTPLPPRKPEGKARRGDRKRKS
ncbi:MAG TPA: phosphate signaling complex protein PhoU [Alphaproteobacteria bacterium]|nr:phosphate signaling complex protein PhoU [Alphaproteobacteria bacterium]